MQFSLMRLKKMSMKISLTKNRNQSSTKRKPNIKRWLNKVYNLDLSATRDYKLYLYFFYFFNIKLIKWLKNRILRFNHP